MREKEEYDWIDDPFDEKKAAAEQERATMSGGKKAALGCGCLFVVVAFVVLGIYVAVGMIDILIGVQHA